MFYPNCSICLCMSLFRCDHLVRCYLPNLNKDFCATCLHDLKKQTKKTDAMMKHNNANIQIVYIRSVFPVH